MQVRHLIIINSTSGLAQTIYCGYNEAKAQSQIQRLQQRESVTHIFYRQGKGKYQTLKG